LNQGCAAILLPSPASATPRALSQCGRGNTAPGEAVFFSPLLPPVGEEAGDEGCYRLLCNLYSPIYNLELLNQGCTASVNSFWVSSFYEKVFERGGVGGGLSPCLLCPRIHGLRMMVWRPFMAHGRYRGGRAGRQCGGGSLGLGSAGPSPRLWRRVSSCRRSWPAPYTGMLPCFLGGSTSLWVLSTAPPARSMRRDAGLRGADMTASMYPRSAAMLWCVEQLFVLGNLLPCARASGSARPR
jgi:hypothetical protein